MLCLQYMKKANYLGWFLLVVSFLVADDTFAQDQPQNNLSDFAEQLTARGLRDNQAFAFLEELTTVASSRLNGTPGAAAAVEWARQTMLDLGLAKIHLEETQVPHWVRGSVASARVVNSRQVGTMELVICALGGSVATPEFGVTAPVVEVKSFVELTKLSAQANGRIVFFNRAMDPTRLNTFRAYGEAADQRVLGAVEAAKVGAVAVLVRSLTTRLDQVPHTGMLSYDAKIPAIPAAAISTVDADRLSSLLKIDPTLKVNLCLNCRTLPPVVAANVVGQLTGSEKPDEIILLGAHLDSWDLGVGAHDDGAGCVHVLEALRLLKSQGVAPRRTIRAVLFMNEEFGGSGGKDYVGALQRQGEKHLAAIESDRGGFLPFGFGVDGDSLVVQKIRSWQYLFKPLQGQSAAELLWIRPGGGGVDIQMLQKQGTILMSLVPAEQCYFDVHHSANDVLTSVNARELELGAIAMAILAFQLAQEGI